MQLSIERIKDPVEKQEVELVESKGIGHPDSICDSVCEACGNALAQYYKRKFGTVLHYNVDKALLVAGASRPSFGGGKITSPAKLTIAGRVTDRVAGKALPVRELIRATAKKYLSQFSIAKFDVIIDVKSGAANLALISKRKKPVANDTSFGAAHYPLSKTEQLVLDISAYLSSEEFRKKFPAAGQDIKVMGVRTGKKTKLTLAIAFVGKHVKDMESYIAIKNRIISHISSKFKADVDVNTLDDVTGDAEHVYITVSGLSAEMGDDGQVGRGNRYNGLITPGRPMSIEAVAGKNSRHPGRSYQVAAFSIARALVDEAGVKSAEVKLVTNIGAPLEEPTASIKSDSNLSKIAAEKIIRKEIRKTISC